MNRDDFIKKYKVGDKIRLSDWHENLFVEILFNGDQVFLGKNELGIEIVWSYQPCYDNDGKGWLPYTEPKKKKKVKMSQAVFNRIESNGCFLPDGLYSSKEDAIIDWLPYKLIQWPLVINGEEQWITVEVEE